MAQSLQSNDLSKCSECSIEFNVIVLANGENWTAEDQHKFHLAHDHAIVDFGGINYLFFNPLSDKHLYRPIAGLPKQIGNVRMVNAGHSSNGGLPSALAQVFKLHSEYTKRMAAKTFDDYDEHLASIYEETVVKGEGLCLMLVRQSSDRKEVETSEYNLYQTFKYQELFYGQPNATNALQLNDDALYDMQRVNYRRIEYKLKNRRYIRFTSEMIERLRKQLPDSIYDASEGGYQLYSKDQLVDVFDYLQALYADFFRHQEPKKDDLREESFFENNLDAGSIMWKLSNYIRSKHLYPNEIDRDLEERYHAAKGAYIKLKL